MQLSKLMKDNLEKATEDELTSSNNLLLQVGNALKSLPADKVAKAGDLEKIKSKNPSGLFFIGNGVNYAQTKYYVGILGGHSYRLTFKDNSWEYPSGLSSSSYIFNITIFKIDGTSKNILYVYNGSNVNKEYFFYVDENDSNIDYIQFGGRANEGVTVEATIEDVTEVKQIQEKISVEKTEKLPIVNLLQKVLSSGHPGAERADRVCTGDCVALPKDNITIKIKLPSTIKCAFAAGNSRGASFDDSGWKTNGSTYTFASGKKCYSIGFATVANNQPIPVSDVKSYVASGAIEFTYNVENTDTYERNRDKLQFVESVKQKLTTSSSQYHKILPLFAHISDVHGDYARLKNFVDYCKKIGVDAILNSGDTTMYNHVDGSKFQDEIISGCTIPYLFCIGNHESQSTGQTSLFEDNMQNLANTQEYMASSDVVTNKCYYYKDFTAQKIRVITVNYYENGVYKGYLGQSQLEWFIQTLNNTPSGYGVVVMIHSPEDRVVAESPYDVFRQKHREVTYQEDGFCIENTYRPILMLVDAFQSRTTKSISYSISSTGESVNISADFTSAVAEFVCYVAGHRHEDWIGYYSRSTNKQLCLGVTAGTALYGDSTNPAWANQEDLPRGSEGIVQDAFNIYGFDMEKGVVKIVRIGSCMTETMVKREVMEIPYK